MNINKLMKQAKKMQQDIAKTQESLADQEVTGSSGGGAVEVVMTCNRKLKSMVIDPDVGQEDVEMLSDLIIAAVNNALDLVEAEVEAKMSGLTGGMGAMSGLL